MSCPQVLKTTSDSDGNRYLHLDNGKIHTVPPGFQADCNNGQYRNVPILTPPPTS